MKKIFAIALALVMALSMTSAFAANACSTFDWTCTVANTNCGKAKVEVIPYVMVNDGCKGTVYEVSTCASAINTKDVYYAVKVTVDAYVDAEWMKAATIELEGTGVGTLPVPGALTVLTDYEEEQVFYLKADGTWADASAKGFDVQTVVLSVNVTDAKKAKVCATIKSEHNGVGTWKVGDYTVDVATNSDAGTIKITKGTKEFTMTWAGGKVNNMTATDVDFYNEVLVKFNLSGCGFGTCVDKTIIKRNFGWKDKVESCFSWSDKGASVVNPDCVVAIPKTGDVSVVAYAVMAVVAAAGTMLKK